MPRLMMANRVLWFIWVFVLSSVLIKTLWYIMLFPNTRVTLSLIRTRLSLPRSGEQQQQHNELVIDGEHISSCTDLFQFDAASWTLKYLKPKKIVDSIGRGECQKYITKFIKGHGSKIKRILYNDSSTENLGCTAKSEMCSEHAHYDHELHTRVNTPPCCLQKILTIYQRMSAALQEHGIPHCMVFGGVIGYLRYKGMTPYDQDLDMVIESKYWNSEILATILDSLRTKHGHVAKQIFGNTQIHLQYSKTNKNFVDLWSYNIIPRGDQLKFDVNHKEYVLQDYDDAFPFTLVDYNGFQTYLPSNPLKFVEKQYGRYVVENERNCTKAVDRKCVI